MVGLFIQLKDYRTVLFILPILQHQKQSPSITPSHHCPVCWVVYVKKYIPLSVLEGLEVWIQLENVKNCLKYQFFPYPALAALGRYATSEEELNKF